MAVQFNRCFRPFKNKNVKCNAALRNITESMAAAYGIDKQSKICGTCRLKCGSTLNSLRDTAGNEMPDVQFDFVAEPSTSLESHSSTGLSQPLSAKAPSAPSSQELTFDVDKKLSALGTSPIQRKRIGQKGYCKIKRKKTTDAIQQVLSSVLEYSDEDDEHNCEILEQLKSRFHAPDTTNSEKIVLLTLTPKSWSTRKTAKQFQTTRRKVQLAKQLVAEHGILTSPNKKTGQKLTETQIDVVKKFYEDDQNSKMMAGAKDFVSCKQEDGKRVHCQKRLVLCNLKELYARFKELNPEFKIGFSKFAELRPRYCVLAGSSGTHCVCVCILHENTTLMFEGSQIAQLSRDKPVSLQSIRDCIRNIICKEPTLQCFSGDKKNPCKKCPGITDLADYLTQLYDEHEVESIKFKVWRNTDRTTLKMEEMTSDEFVEEFCAQLEKLRVHDFIAKKQAEFVAKTKKTLAEGEVIVQCDFAENYAFIVQNAVQAFHYNNDQATIYTVVMYYKDEGKLRHKSLAIISDNLVHDSIAVHVYNKIIIKFLHSENLEPKKIIYVSDGGPSHYKNRFTFANLMHHENDFNIPAEWHFYATSHGKSACDGVGGNLKRQAARASLQLSTDNQILTPAALYDWAKKTLPDTSVIYSEKAEYYEAKEQLKDRYAKAKRVLDTQKNHSFIPTSQYSMLVKQFSSADSGVNFETQKTSRGKKK